MSNREPLSELDLLGYADGLLDHDPGRKAQVEAYLRTTPEAAEQVQAYRAQTQALRQAYGGRATEPVPQHLLDIATGPPERGRFRAVAARAAAVMAICAATGLSGWYLGQQSVRGPDLAGDRLPPVIGDLVTRTSGLEWAEQASLDAVSSGAMLRWRNNGVEVSLRIPELGALGYELTARRNVTHSGVKAVRLSYAAADGATLRLFIAPSRRQGSQQVSVNDEVRMPMAFWSHGPLTVAATADGEQREVSQLAEAIRDIILHESDRNEPQPDRPEFQIPPGKLEVTAGATAPQTTDSVESISSSPIGVEKSTQ